MSHLVGVTVGVGAITAAWQLRALLARPGAATAAVHATPENARAPPVAPSSAPTPPASAAALEPPLLPRVTCTPPGAPPPPLGPGEHLLRVQASSLAPPQLSRAECVDI